MTSSDIKRIFHIEDIMNLPQAVNQVLFSAERDDVYRELIRIHQGDMSYDWFQSLYEQELSQRNQKKQDFTPSTLGLICSLIDAKNGNVYWGLFEHKDNQYTLLNKRQPLFNAAAGFYFILLPPQWIYFQPEQ